MWNAHFTTYARRSGIAVLGSARIVAATHAAAAGLSGWTDISTGAAVEWVRPDKLAAVIAALIVWTAQAATTAQVCWTFALQ